MPAIADPHPLPAIPKLGQTRCYWSLLSADLDFLYVDPVLHAHLGAQAHAIIGRKLLEFVHPDEHASAHQDLGKVLESRTLHGSVTRVRYSRLGRVRARLGYTGVYDKFTDEDKVSFDEDYMACDLVINWAAEGLVLCFIHAAVDMSPQDNDEHHRTHWTNWCGTPNMSVEHGTELYHALFLIAPHAAQGAPPPTRVFQILHNSTDRPTLFSWPAEGYMPADYGRLANDIQIGGANGSDAKTGCTRRYKAQQVLNSADGSVRDVESIFIPHGHIIFACHKATPHRPRGHPNSYPLYPITAQFYETPGHSHSQYYSSMSVSSQVEPYHSAGGHAYSYHAQPTQQQSPAPQNSQAHSHPSSSLPNSEPSSPGGSRGTGTHSPYPQVQASWATSTPSPQHSPYVEHPQAVQRYPQPFLDEVPPPRHRSGQISPDLSGAQPGGSRETYPGGGRAGGNPPMGVSRCAACKSTSSPEWRKGPSGRKDLCNACGLRYSRARAKKEGIAVQKRRKEAAKVPPQVQPHESSQKRRTHTPNGYAEYALDERHYHVGGGSGGEGSGSTPSPSPPHEYPHHAHAQHASPSTSMYSYSTPVDPRQNTMYIPPSHSYSSQQHHPQHHQQQQQHHSNDFMGPTSSPAPGDLSAASPAGGHATVSSTSVPSYERTGMPPEPRRALDGHHTHV
ncbi:hypothetical protein K439DRAFT_1661083 [Ramaria rubella]|nr:hypothetical protein K439DRAFT_1661083 [Ramaria rubella]